MNRAAEDCESTAALTETIMNKITESAAQAVVIKTKEVKSFEVGQRFGRLVVIERIPQMPYTPRRSLFQCDCGKTKIIVEQSVKSGLTQSCGCIRREQVIARLTKHGGTGTKVYVIWKSMKDRCRNPKNKEYSVYGGRGITVCDGFLEYQKFFNSVGERPTPQHSIDRPYTNGNYSCGECASCVEHGWKKNVRWATRAEQMNNTTRNHLITANGITRTLKQWSDASGLDRNTIATRLKSGMSESDAVSLPLIKKRRFNPLK